MALVEHDAWAEGSRITRTAKDLRLVTMPRKRLGLQRNVDVVRWALQLLDEPIDRRALREEYRRASHATRRATRDAIGELDHLSQEGID